MKVLTENEVNYPTFCSYPKAFIKKKILNICLKLKSKNFHIYEFSFFLSGIYLPSKMSKSDLLNEPINATTIICIICSFVIAYSFIGIIVSFIKWLNAVYGK